MAHPMRLRILFACRARARTNKELARLLDTTPGTIHYHLKLLVEQDFLRAEPPRPGPRGSTEQPYRSTGKSWALSGTDDSARVMLEVAAQEVLTIEPGAEINSARLGMSLAADEVEELDARLRELLDEFAARSRTGPVQESDDEDTVDVTFFFALYRSPDDPTM